MLARRPSAVMFLLFDQIIASLLSSVRSPAGAESDRPRGNDYDEFASWVANLRFESLQRAFHPLFVNLGELTSHKNLVIAQNRTQLPKSLPEAMRCLEANARRALGTSTRRASAILRSFDLVGRNPMNTNPWDSTPATLIVAVTALGPGTGSTLMPASRAARTKLAPGSEMPGVPASVTRAIDSPALRRETR